MGIKKLFILILFAISIIYLILIIIIIFYEYVIYFPNDQDFVGCQGFSEYSKINYKGTRFYYSNEILKKTN